MCVSNSDLLGMYLVNVFFSLFSQYLASGHTSPDHSIIIHYLRPEIKPFNKLVGHLRSPWCLSFDPLCMYILYSGCLGGIVNRWNIKVGASLKTSLLHTQAGIYISRQVLD